MSVAESLDLTESVVPGRAQVVQLVPPAPPEPVEDATSTASPLARFVGGPFPNLRPASRTAEGPYANLVAPRR